MLNIKHDLVLKVLETVVGLLDVDVAAKYEHLCHPKNTFSRQSLWLTDEDADKRVCSTLLILRSRTCRLVDSWCTKASSNSSCRLEGSVTCKSLLQTTIKHCCNSNDALYHSWAIYPVFKYLTLTQRIRSKESLQKTHIILKAMILKTTQ